jgi:anti-sigma regulatory factor (Ser/Thr protein kinase)
VEFVDMAQIGRNPARIIPRWRQFVDEHQDSARPIRGIGEPIWAGRSDAELAECQVHERLLNVAFADGPGWSLLCPYDTDTLEPAVADEARRSHPLLLTYNGTSHASDDYLHADLAVTHLRWPLLPPPADAEPTGFDFDFDTLRTIRDLVADHAKQAGLDNTAAAHFTFAANEIATNSLRHGAGRGTIRLWRDNNALICEVADAGHLHGPPLLGRERPPIHQTSGRGLWLANQLCDLVQVRSTPDGTTVRLHTTRG